MLPQVFGTPINNNGKQINTSSNVTIAKINNQTIHFVPTPQTLNQSNSLLPSVTIKLSKEDAKNLPKLVESYNKIKKSNFSNITARQQIITTQEQLNATVLKECEEILDKLNLVCNPQIQDMVIANVANVYSTLEQNFSEELQEFENNNSSLSLKAAIDYAMKEYCYLDLNNPQKPGRGKFSTGQIAGMAVGIPLALLVAVSGLILAVKHPCSGSSNSNFNLW